MLYELLKKHLHYLESKPDKTGTETELLTALQQAFLHIIQEKDRECLAPNEILVRICPSTGRPALVCHEGEGNCLCLHSETPEEDMRSVREWLEKEGRMPVREGKLLEAVADLAYNAGAAGLCNDKDSRTVIADLIHAAGEFEARHRDTDWDNTDYLQAIDRHYRELFGQEPSGTLEEPEKLMDEVLEDEDKAECFVGVILHEINSDEESCCHVARQLINAYRSDDCDGILMALSGWSMASLLEQYRQAMDEQEE